MSDQISVKNDVHKIKDVGVIKEKKYNIYPEVAYRSYIMKFQFLWNIDDAISNQLNTSMNKSRFLGKGLQLFFFNDTTLVLIVYLC